METTKEFKLNNKILKFVNTVDEDDISKIFINRYFYSNIRGLRQPMIIKQKKDEYYNQLQIQLHYLQGTKLTQRDFNEALIEGCKHHIVKYGRLLISNLWGQLSVTMHIIDATNGIFHNYIKTEEDGIELRGFYQKVTQEDLIDFILVPDPNDLGGFGRQRNLVQLKSIIK